ncbi:GuaB3 family IMP dehydrogenase-related protein [Nakamurella flavida]|uniref:GuaB3 family IMP dehydrogenase-related protein n=1 Tax=Nakamurella flavida TaxID=363630 RepID=A0A938YS46_9ACTN|nr:GuaB3 family IMP dehydrogenase-related protein [Nakamurella flavida]MBM9475918.1 GuaB3 family IMP dehydrogenase-related protein [Nakamurella flavida]MBM9478422.1 GuaB3 family IMP dehydrogenase-related protein [Nakamurella flavida]MDP9777796.1 IMP dehydrogenase [Nakamurella flavida]
MSDRVEIGMGREARRAYALDDIAIVPSRRTRSSSEVSTAWQVDAYRFEIPMLTRASDAVVSPAVATEVGRLGGLGVLDGEGLWSRYEDPQAVIDELVAVGMAAQDPDEIIAALQKAYSRPVDPELLTRSIGEIRAGGGTVAVRLSPQNSAGLAATAIAAGVELLIIQGTIVSAEHVQRNGEPLNLKSFIADLEVPVIVGGCTNYQTATHLMRTGAAGVIVGTGAGQTSTTDAVLGISVPMATAIADAAAARRSYLDETGGRYVQVIAAGDIDTSADVAKAIACGADAVMIGEPLATAQGAPADGWFWPTTAAHPVLPRGFATPVGPADISLEQLLLGPATGADGRSNLFGALRRAMAKAGYSTLKDFQRVGLTVRH